MAPRLPKNPPAPVGHNSAAAEEAERIQLLGFIAKITEADGKIEEARGPLKAAQKNRSSIIQLAKSAGFTAHELKARMEEMARAPSENAIQEGREARHRRWLGIISPEQTKMFTGDETPIETRDEFDWQGRGFSAGLRGLPAKLPEGIPPRLDQAWLKGHESGSKEYRAALVANVPGGKSISEQAKADFREDNPDVQLPDDSEPVV